MNTLNQHQIEALTASRDEWKARALAAERGVEHREHLLTALSALDTEEGRVRMALAVVINGREEVRLCVHGNHGDEAEMLNRWASMMGPQLELFAIALHKIATPKRTKRARGAS